MENVEPFECCPSIGRHISYTHVPKRNPETRTKSNKPVDKMGDRLSRTVKPLKPFGEMFFKQLDDKTKKRNAEAATVSNSSMKPYTQWLENWAPGDPLPLVPPGFHFNLCDDIGEGKLLNRKPDKKKRPRFGPINNMDQALLDGFGQKSLGPKIKDSIYSLLSMVAKARGLWVDDKNKLRCPPGTPNANQFTDITGSNCFIPVPMKPKGAISSGARLARRAATSGLIGAMSPGARDYPTGYGGEALVGARENLERGRSMINQAFSTSQDFKNGLFTLPSGQPVRHFKQNAAGRAYFLAAVQELMPNVDPAEAAQFWDNALKNAPLTTLQRVQMEDYLDSYFQSFFMELKQNPEKAKWITKLVVGTNDPGNGWEMDLRGTASSVNKKGQTVYDPNAPISQSGFHLSVRFNPVAAYYLAKGDGNDKNHTAHGSQFNMRSQGLYTGTHEFGHINHFGQAMENLGFSPDALTKGKNGEWQIDLRNMTNPLGDPRLARIQAMIARIESFQSGNRYETLPTGQRVRRTTKDMKEAVEELYRELYSTMTDDVGGTDEDFKLLQRMIGARYGQSNLIETRAEAYAAIRHFGPQAVQSFAREHAAFQATNPSLFPTPETETEITDNVYAAMNRIFNHPPTSTKFTGTVMPDVWHERNNEFGVSTITGGPVTPTGTPVPSPSPRGSGLSRLLPSRSRRSSTGSGISGPMGPSLTGALSPRKVTGRTPDGSALTGAISTRGKRMYDRPGREDANPGAMTIELDTNKAIRVLDTDAANLVAAAGFGDNIMDELGRLPDGQTFIEQPGVLEKLAEAAGVGLIDSMSQTGYVDNTAMIRRASGSQLMDGINKKYAYLRSGPDRDKYVREWMQDLESKMTEAESKLQRYQEKLTKIRAVQDKLRNDPKNTDLLDEANGLSFHGMTLDETEKLMQDKLRRRKREREILVKRLDQLTSGDVETFVSEKKNQAQTQILTTLTNMKRLTDRFPQLKGMILSFSTNDSRSGSAGLSIVSGRLVPNQKIGLPDDLVEDVESPDFSRPYGSTVGSFTRFTRLTLSSTVFHEGGHNLDLVSQLEGYGLKTGINSPPVVDQIRTAGPELGDSAAGTMYALATGKSLTYKIDDMNNSEKGFFTHFVGWGLGINGNPREAANEGSLIRAFAFSGHDTLLPSGRSSLNYQVMDVGHTAQWMTTGDTYRTGGVSRPKQGQERRVNRITARMSEILSEALGWDVNQGVFGEAAGVLDEKGILADTSKYAKSLRTERVAEGFALLNMDKDFGFDTPGPSTVRQKQAAGAMANLIAGLPSRDNVVGMSADAKAELIELRKELLDNIEFPDPASKPDLTPEELYGFNKISRPRNLKYIPANTIDFDTNVTEEQLEQMPDLSWIRVRPYTGEARVMFATGAEIEKAKSGGLTGAMSRSDRKPIQRYAQFETSQGSQYSVNVDGRVQRVKPTSGSTIEESAVVSSFDNTVFVSTEDLQALKLSFDRGVGLSPDGKLVGLKYDDSLVNKSTFKNLRARGESFDRAFKLSGGRIEEFEIVPDEEPSIGLHPFEWNDKDGKYHPGNAIVNLSLAPERTDRSPKKSYDGLTGAMHYSAVAENNAQKQTSRVAESEARVEKLQKAYDHYKQTGDWLGADFGVTMSIKDDVDLGNLDVFDGGKPRNLTKAELAEIEAEEKTNIEVEILNKIKQSRKELVLQKFLSDQARTQKEQGIVRLEDIPEDELKTLIEEGRNLTDEDFAVGNGLRAAIHVGAPSLDGGVLDPDKTDGGGAENAGASGNTGALNQMTLSRVRRQREDALDRLASRQRIVEAMRDPKRKITPKTQYEAQLLNEKFGLNGRSDRQSFKEGVEYDLNHDWIKANEDGYQRIIDSVEKYIPEEQGVVDSYERLFARLDESPTMGFLSAYPASRGLGTQGYYGRNAHKAVPKDIATPLTEREANEQGLGYTRFRDVKDREMLNRWEQNLRGAGYLIIGDDATVTSGLGPNDELQLIGKNKPLFGFSAKNNLEDRQNVEFAANALVARAIKLHKDGREVNPESVLNYRRNQPPVSGLTGAMSSQNTADILARSKDLGVDIERQEREIMPRIIREAVDDRRKQTAARIASDLQGKTQLSGDYKAYARKLATDKTKTDLDIFREMYSPEEDNSFGMRLQVAQEIARGRGDTKLVAQIDDFIKEVKEMTPEQWNAAIDDAIEKFESPFDNRTTVLMNDVNGLLDTGRYQTVHQGRKTQDGNSFANSGFDVPKIRRSAESMLFSIPAGATDEKTTAIRPSSGMALQKTFGEVRENQLKNIYGDDIEIQHRVPAAGKMGRQAAFSSSRRKNSKADAQYGRNLIVLRPETSTRTLTVKGDSVSDVSTSGADVIAPSARLSTLSENGRLASTFFDPMAILFEAKTGRKDTLASASSVIQARYAESLTLGGFDLSDVESIVSDARGLRGAEMPDSFMNAVGVNPWASFTNLIAAARKRESIKKEHGIDVVINHPAMDLDEVEPFNTAMTKKWVSRKISAGDWKDITADDLKIDDKTTPYEAYLKYNKISVEQGGHVPIFDHPKNDPKLGKPDFKNNFISMIDEELKRIETAKGRGGSLTGAMSGESRDVPGTRLTRRMRESSVKARISALKASGLSVSEIAKRLKLAESTVYSMMGE